MEIVYGSCRIFYWGEWEWMNKNDYLKEFKKYLKYMNKEEKEDILNEYDMYFYSG